MNPQSLVAALAATLSMNRDERSGAEQALAAWSHEANFSSVIFQVVMSEEVNVDLRVSAATYFKNLVLHSWSPRKQRPNVTAAGTQFLLADDVKESIKSQLCGISVQSHPKVRRCINEALKLIADKIWPEGWPDLVPQLMSFLTPSAPQQYLQGALSVIRVILISRQYSTFDPMNKRRWPIHAIAETVLPVCLQLLQSLVAQEHHGSAELVLLQTTVLRIFHSCTVTELPPYLIADQSRMGPWLQAFRRVLMDPIPQGVEPADLELRETHSAWVLKKWVMKVLNNLITRHGDPALVKQCAAEPSEDEISFYRGEITPENWAIYSQQQRQRLQVAYMLQDQYSVGIFECVLNTMANVARNQFVSQRVLVYCVKYTTMAIRIAKMWQLLAPSADTFLQSVVFRLCCFSPVEVRLFSDDPVEFIRRQNAMSDLVHSVRLLSMFLLRDILKLRKRDHLINFMNYLSGVLTKHNQMPANRKSPLEKETVMTCLGTLSMLLGKRGEFPAMLESILTQHVFPELTSAHPMLRVRAIWVLCRYWNLNWSSPQILRQAITCTLDGLSNKYLPVRVAAATAIPYLVKHPIGQQIIGASLGHILQYITEIVREIDNDDLVHSIEALVEAFGDAIGPYALQLIARLIDSFNRASTQDEGDVEAMAAYASLETIISIIDEVGSHDNSPEMFNELHATVMPFAYQLLGSPNVEYWELGIQLVATLSANAPFVSREMWVVLPQLYTAWSEWAPDYVDTMSPVFDHLINTDPATFCQSADLQQIPLAMLTKYLTTETPVFETQTSLRLLEIIACSCRGKLDHVIAQVIPMLLHRLSATFQATDQEDAMELQLSLLVSLQLCMWYNPLMTLQLMEAQQATASVFKLTFDYVTMMHLVKDKKICVMGLSTLFSVPPAQLPESIRTNFGSIIGAVVNLLMELWQQRDEEHDRREALNAGLADPGDPDASLVFQDVGVEAEEVADDADVGGLSDAGMLSTQDVYEMDSYDEMAWDQEARDREWESVGLMQIDEAVYFYHQHQPFMEMNQQTWAQYMNALGEEMASWYQKICMLAVQTINSKAGN